MHNSSKTVFDRKANVQIDSAATTGRQGKYIPVVEALSLWMFCFLFTRARKLWLFICTLVIIRWSLAKFTQH